MVKYPKDQELVKEILKGNESSLREFYKDYCSKVFSFIQKRVEKKEDAEEILQDSLLASLEAMRDFAGDSSLWTFVCAIAHHKIVDFYRKKKLKQLFFSQMPNLENIVSQLSGPEEKYNEEELKSEIKKCLGKLPVRYQKILKLKYLEGFSVWEIAQETKETVKSVESALFRARRAFAKVFVK